MAALLLGYSGYFAAMMAFFWVRAYTWTEEQALPAKGKKPGFGPQISLGNAAIGLFKHNGPRVLLAACVTRRISLALGSWFYRRLWRNHRLPYFQNENYWFGLTMLTGDRVLGTQLLKGKAKHSKTVLNLGVESSPADLG